MAEIYEQINDIRVKVYGEEVRSAIADAIDRINTYGYLGGPAQNTNRYGYNDDLFSTDTSDLGGEFGDGGSSTPATTGQLASLNKHIASLEAEKNKMRDRMKDYRSRIYDHANRIARLEDRANSLQSRLNAVQTSFNSIG